MSKKLKLLSTCLILSATSACVINGTAPAVPSDSYCKIARGISYDSEQDTPETVKEIEAHNSRYACVCNADCPKQP